MVIAVLALSILLLVSGIVLSLRLIRRTGRGLPWLLLCAALVLMTARRLIALADVTGQEPPAPVLIQQMVALFTAALLVGAVRSLGRFIDEVQQEGHSKRETEEAYQNLVANLPLLASALDPSGKLTFLNPSLVPVLTGYDASEVEALPSRKSLIHPEDLPNVEKALERALGGETVHQLARFYHRDRSLKWAGSILFPRRNEGRVVGVNVLTSDVSERITLEEQLRHAQKMEALGAMAGGIAHDFNNLLSSILGNVELAERRIPPDHPARKNLDDAGRAALRASEHARHILDFGRRKVSNPRPVSLNEVSREAVNLVRHTVDPRIEFRARTEAGLWPVLGDHGELVQVLVNLLLNARDVLPGGGHVAVETGNVILDETYARVHAEGRTGEFVRLAVADDGPGMPAEVRRRIFEPFFTTKDPARGTGLGLALVYGTVRRHEGWVSCYSEPGRGTRFTLYLPRAAGPGGQPAAVEAAAAEIPGGHETVLLVDDDEDLRVVGVETLQELGYSVLTARDGVEALEVYGLARDRIRLVILDLSMPRMNGRDTLARLRAADSKLPVLMTSGHPLDGDAHALLAEGAVGFVEKPYRLAQIGRAVRGALDGWPGSVPAERAAPSA